MENVGGNVGHVCGISGILLKLNNNNQPSVKKRDQKSDASLLSKY